MFTTLELQRRLTALGFDPGPADGIFGRRTIAAVKAFQKAKGLTVDGVVGSMTTAALNAEAGAQPPLAGMLTPPWFSLARQKMGMIETNAATKAFLKSDGSSVGDPSKLPWCGDFVQTCIAITLPEEHMVVNPYLARNWTKFGVSLSAAHLGAIAVFWRGARTGIEGHVGFVAGQDTDTVHLLAGNQGNKVSIARVGKDRLLGYRWPSTVAIPIDALPMTTLAGTISTNEA